MHAPEKIASAYALFSNGNHDGLYPLLEELLEDFPQSFEVNYLAGMYYATKGDVTKALQHFDLATAASPTDVNARIMPVFKFPDFSPAGGASSRDRLLYVIDNLHSQLTSNPNYHIVLRYAARYCHFFNNTERVIPLYQELVSATENADDYFEMASNETVQGLDIDAAYMALQKAMSLNPEKYRTEINKNTTSLFSARSREKSATNRKIMRAKYPRKEQFHGDIDALIRNHIATEHKTSPKFITKQTKFFTIGSCFAVNLYKSLLANGYNASCMWLADNFNTTFANKHLVDWFSGELKNPDIAQRIHELSIDIESGLEKHDRDYYVNQIKNADVFIMTLGVAAAFFSPAGDFVMPRPSELHMRALTEHYEFKTSSVSQNVENVRYIINAIRRLAPHIKIVLTVSPVPLHATFEFESAVVADCLSKSVMRVTAHEVVHHCGFKDVYYWPSFEVFRWAGSNAGPLYSADDNDSLHVSQYGIEANIRCFIDLFSESATLSI